MADNPCQAIYMRAFILALLLWFPNSAHAEPDPALPRIVSLNLCVDPYLMEFAIPEQIIALTWNSHDPTQSPFAARAASYPVTGGRAEIFFAIPDGQKPPYPDQRLRAVNRS